MMFKCPNCGKPIEISQALKHQIEDDVRKRVEESIRKEVEEKTFVEIQDLKKQLSEKDEKVQQLREEELKLREEKRKLEEKEKDLELELERRLDEEKKKIEERVLKQAVEEHRLRDLEKDKKIADLQRQLEDALRKATLGSQQLQGEVLELDLEESLRTSFPNDNIEPIPKGKSGADIRQVVKSPKGYVCGVILWEAKRAKTWKDDWIPKLKQDLRVEKANIPVIVTNVFPKGVNSAFDLKDGVWVVSFSLVLPLATLLRKNLLDVAFQKVVSAHKEDKADILYEYITSHEFRQQLEALIEVFNEMQSELNKERVIFEKVWKVREGQIKRLITSTANVVGSIQGRIGSSSFQIKGIDLPELEKGN